MILVTGGTGLVGAHLLFDLVKAGHQVRALKRASSNVNQVLDTFSYYDVDHEKLAAEIEWVDGDVLDILSLATAMDCVETVYHCAATVSFTPKDHEWMMKVNVEGTANVVNAALDAKVKTLCHVSSVAAIGREGSSKPITEDAEWTVNKHTTVYGKSKRAAELEVWRGQAEGLEVVIVNPTLIMGPGVWGQSSTQIVKKVADGLSFYTSGSNGFIDVRDVAGIMQKLVAEGPKNQRFILVAENWKLRDAVDQIADELGKTRPKFKANNLITGLVWRLEWLRSTVIGGKPILTRETTNTANSTSVYDNSKIKAAIDYEFIQVSKSITDTCKIYLKDHQN